MSYYAGDGFVSVAVPYWGRELEMMLIVPEAGNYAKVRAELSSELLDSADAKRRGPRGLAALVITPAAPAGTRR